MNIVRKITKYVSLFLEQEEEHSPTLLLSGARQVGKSTLIKQICSSKPVLFLNLFELPQFVERLDAIQSFTELESLFLLEWNFKPGTGTILVIDEAQESQNLGRWIRFFKEKWSHQKVIVFGSILSRLFEAQNNYPVGRVIEYTLRPFDLGEFLLAANKNAQRELIENFTRHQKITPTEHSTLMESYVRYLQCGGMPEIVTRFLANQQSLETGWSRLLRQYSMDVGRYLGEDHESLFINTFQRLAEIICQGFKYSQILSSHSPVYRRLPHLLEVLEKWHLIFKAPLKTKQPESASAQPSKRYLFDVGLINVLLHAGQPLKWQNRSEMENTIYGKLQENFVLTELMAMQPHPVQLCFFRENRNSQEVDFLLPAGTRTIPIEVKSQTTINRNSLSPLVQYLEHTRQQTGVLIYNGPPAELTHKEKQILALPPYLAQRIPDLVPH